ncbi:hypothetical protein [Xenorhabdus bovienii]|uniref:hypothetical protein n=1 Tax=Xenorhabdus bovienii TaxID=40576 RepID=UPI0023B344EA|nr:hypothetical protein [Xenorhabdus bovienii]MDE9455723.1 hypothetical protein [Xenorhabdus bovienii]MDE9483761.1 hypothetical protein [Xenorhabdus bovienii]MDE9552709.1 hypothetical protein [Xenorhabdus bovienii]
MSTVIIACKLANGLYLDVGEQRVAVNGFAKGFIDETGFGLTYGIDAELWKAWLAENIRCPTKAGCELKNNTAKIIPDIIFLIFISLSL